MAFDFSAAIKQASVMTSSKALEAIVLGPSGSGKSYLLGTLGVKTLYLYSQGESHGSKSARVNGGDMVVPICVDYDDTGTALTADDTYKRLLSILGDVDGIKKAGFKAIAVDGASELETIVRNTGEWKKQCLSNNGKHNTFGEGPATIAMFRPVINALKHLQLMTGCHFVMTLILDVKELGMHGDYQEAAPRLKGFAVAEQVLQQFGDVLVVGKLQKDDKIKYKLQFMTELTKSSKDEHGQLKRAINFSPRLAGVATLPATMDADLSQVIKLKEGK